MSETHDIQGILEKHYMKGSFSHFKDEIWVQREMDRDEICFFNLIELIEEYGYTSIDYLYYKKRDGLVALQWDTDVMKMLEENESEKNVSLFVTRQRIATIAPTKSNKEPSKSAAKKAKGTVKPHFALFCICFSIQENLIYA